jgi:hypothetical protein
MVVDLLQLSQALVTFGFSQAAAEEDSMTHSNPSQIESTYLGSLFGQRVISVGSSGSSATLSGHSPFLNAVIRARSFDHLIGA